MNKNYVIYGLAAVLLVAAAISLRFYMQEREAKAGALSANAVLQQEKARLQKDFNDAQANYTAADLQRQAAEKEITIWKNKPATPQAVNDHRPAGMGAVAIEKCTDASGKTQDTLVATGAAQDNLDVLHRAEADAATCKADMIACAAKLAARDRQIPDEVKINGLSEKQTGNLQTVVNGGTWRQKALKAGKCIAVDGVAAGVGGYFKGWKGAAIGGAGGQLACTLFF